MHNVKVFCDFDGTVAAADVGDLIFQQFAGADARDIIDAWAEGHVSGTEMYRVACASVQRVEIGALNELIDSQELDAGFPDFVSFCRSKGMELIIVSDGFGYYIDRILGKYGYSDLRVYANRLEIRDGIFYPEFPYLNPNCMRTANCKGTHILNEAADDEIRVVAGDGISDSCAADYADIVFAKKSLITYCRSKNISYIEFSDFFDIRREMEKLLSKKRLRTRHRADILRKEAFRIEANS